MKNNDKNRKTHCVTVVIPSYNHVDFVCDAINSVLRQTYPHLELVVIDDGSVDGSAQLIKKMSKEHGFIFLKQTNQGVCKTLNRAINMSSGEFVSILASDDIWAEDKIEKQMKKILSNPGSEFCFSQCKLIDSNNHVVSRKLFPKNCREGNLQNFVFLRQHVPAGTMFFSRRLFDKVGGFDEKLSEEDWDFVIRCASKTQFSAVNEPLLYYRQHARNTMASTHRLKIFQQKFKLLVKNRGLVPAYIFLLSLVLHFIHDVIFALLKVCLNFMANFKFNKDGVGGRNF